MAIEGRVRISLASGELEVEGSLDFVDRYETSIKAMLRRLEDHPSPVRAQKERGGAGPRVGGDTDKRDFGEILHGLPKHATGADQILVAGWFVQKSSADSSFTTGDANKLLIGQGVKLSNAAQAMRGNLTAKRVFKVAGNRWRISKQGDEQLKTLLISE